MSFAKTTRQPWCSRASRTRPMPAKNSAHSSGTALLGRLDREPVGSLREPFQSHEGARLDPMMLEELPHPPSARKKPRGLPVLASRPMSVLIVGSAHRDVCRWLRRRPTASPRRCNRAGRSRSARSRTGDCAGRCRPSPATGVSSRFLGDSMGPFHCFPAIKPHYRPASAHGKLAAVDNCSILLRIKGLRQWRQLRIGTLATRPARGIICMRFSVAPSFVEVNAFATSSFVAASKTRLDEDELVRQLLQEAELSRDQLPYSDEFSRLKRKYEASPAPASHK